MGLFQRKPDDARRAMPGAGSARLTLAAFGKHPGWDDHIPGIGIETEMLARARQVLYVTGVGGQIDSGAWEKLEPEKRLDGYDHAFLWLSPGHVVLGLMWSSADRKGRSKYPMVLCVDGENLAPEFLVARVRPELDRLRELCKSATSSEKVIFDCRAAQERLNALCAAASGATDLPPAIDSRRRFFDGADFGPERVGWLRVLHELLPGSGNTIMIRKSGSGAADLRPRHLRAPLGTASANDALQLWAAFLRCSLPVGAPLLLIARHATGWIDLIAGEPATEHFFCLQASPNALPLATSVPYELAPELRDTLRGIEGKFLMTGVGSPEPAQPPRTPAAPPPLRTTPAQPGQSAAPPGSPLAGASKPARKWWIFLVVLLLGGVGAAAWFLSTGKPAEPAKVPTPTPAPASNAVSKPPPPPPVKGANADRAPAKDLDASSQDAGHLRELLDAGNKALEEKRYGDAMESFVQAQRLRPDDAVVSNCLAQAKLGQVEVDFSQALRACKQAIAAKQLEEARKQLAIANRLKTNDLSAMELSVQLTQLQQALKQEDYEKAMAAAKKALGAGQLDEALRKASNALDLKPGDAPAAELAAQAGKMKQADAGYRTAMTAAKSAFQSRDYSNTIAQATTALSFKTNDADANALLKDAEKRQSAALAALDLDRRYQRTMSDAAQSLAQNDYDNATAKAKAALELKPNDTAANALLAKIQQARDSAKTNVVATAATTAAAPAPATNELARCDVELADLLIKFRVAPHIPTNNCTSKPLERGVGLQQQYIDQCIRRLDGLERKYRENDGVTAERKVDLKQLREAIKYWNP